MLGTPSEIYLFGTMYCYHGKNDYEVLHKYNCLISAASWTIAVTITALVFMPKFREMNYTSAYEVSICCHCFFFYTLKDSFF